MARNIIGSDKFIELFVKTPIDECIARDPKGLYKKAIAGELDSLIGYNSEYLAPKNPDIIISSEENTVDNCVNEIIIEIDKRWS